MEHPFRESRMDKPIAAFLQAGAAVMFAIIGATDGDAILLVVPAVASGVAGLMLWGRAAREGALPRKEPPALKSESARMEEMLTSLQEDVAQLRQDREFYRELYAKDPRDALPPSRDRR